jgi:hypothetical protein
MTSSNLQGQARALAAVGAFLDQELRHHRSSIADLAGDPGVSFPTQALYLSSRGQRIFGGIFGEVAKRLPTRRRPRAVDPRAA